MPKEHMDFLKRGQLWLELGDQIFVHGGFDPDGPLSKSSAETLVWDRELLAIAWQKQSIDPQYKFGPYSDIFLGHTTTQFYKTLKPIKACNVWDLDTGAGWSGKLTIMDAKTKEYWQSDLSPSLYGGNPDRIG